MTEKRPNFFLRHPASAALSTVTVLMALVSAIFFLQDQANNAAKGWVVHTYEVTGHIQLLFNRIKDVQLGVREYTLAGKEEYLAPYYDALKDSLGDDAKNDKLEQHHSIAEELAILRRLSQDNSVQQQNLDVMQDYVKDMEDNWALEINQVKNKTAGASLPDIDFDKGARLMNSVRRLVGIMMAQENTLLTKRIDDDKVNTIRDNALTFSGIIGFYVIMVLSIYFYRRANNRAKVEREKLLQQLLSSNEELERFAYVASHDMQEPLRMIANFSALIADEYSAKLDETGIEYLALVTDSARRMQTMVSDLLEYARLGKDAARFVPVKGSEELQHVLDNLSAAIAESRAQVTSDELPEMEGNPVQFMRLLQNLVGNGLKYQAPGTTPKVHVGVEDQGTEWCFSVKDNGIGMKKEYLTQIFEPFTRLHSWRQYNGTGIGLAVCKKIVENHGGRVWATSEPGKGSTFYFTLPKRRLEEE